MSGTHGGERGWVARLVVAAVLGVAVAGCFSYPSPEPRPIGHHYEIETCGEVYKLECVKVVQQSAHWGGNVECVPFYGNAYTAGATFSPRDCGAVIVRRGAPIYAGGKP